MSDNIEYNAVKVCRDLVAWWEATQSAIAFGMGTGVPAFITRARQVVADYDAEIQRYREPSEPGDFSPNAESRRRHNLPAPSSPPPENVKTRKLGFP